MKLRISPQEFGSKFVCIDESEYDGAPDAGPQLIGQGDTEEEAKRDFLDQWLNREAMRDIKLAKSAMQSWDAMMLKLCGLAS